MATTKSLNIPILPNPEAEWVVSRFHESKNYYSPLFQKFQGWDKQYFSIPDAKRYDWQSNVFVPATYKAIKTLLARIVAALFSTNPPFDAVGVEEKDKAGEVPKKRLIAFQWEKTGIFTKFILFVLQALIRGTSIGKVYWKKDYAYIPRITDYEEDELVTVDEQGKPLGKTKKGRAKRRWAKVKKKKIVYDEKILYEGPDFEVIDTLGGVYPDPYASDMKDSYFIHRVVRTEDYLNKNKEHYKNIDLALNTEYPGDGDWFHSRLENIGMGQPQYRAKAASEGSTTKTDEELAKYELLECHCKYDINGDGFLEDAIITVCNRAVVIRETINPYPEGCFVKIGFMPVLNEFFWQGVCELVEGLQVELNDKRNQRLDNVNLCLQKILVFVEGAIDTQILQNFVFAPGAKLPSKDLNAIKWEAPDDVTASSYNEENILVHDIQETSGAVAALQPTSQSGDIHRTASGLFMLKGEAETNIKLIVQLMETLGLADIAKKYDLLNKHYMTKPQTVRILGESGYEYPSLSPENVRYYNCDFVFKGASAYVNREVRLAQLTKLMDVFTKVPIMFQELDPKKIAKMISNTLGFDEKELMREKINPLLQQAGMQPQLNEQGLGGAPGNVPGIPQDALSRMAGEGLPMEDMRRQIEGLGGVPQ